MNKKNLAIQLSKLETQKDFDIALEQYPTDSNFAADFLWTAYLNGDIENKTVVDLGSGNGILGIGALLLGAKFVYFVDIDKKILELCEKNLFKFDFDNYAVLNLDVTKFKENVDTVVMNPPFGVQNRKADKEFLLMAMKCADSIYSIHKIESRNFIDILTKENKFSVFDIIEKEMDIKKIYKFHSKEKYAFTVGIWILKRNI
jgi:putative methylase